MSISQAFIKSEGIEWNRNEKTNQDLIENYVKHPYAKNLLVL